MTAHPITTPLPGAAADPEVDVPVPRRWLVLAVGLGAGAVLAYFFAVTQRYNLDLVVYRSAVRWWWGGHDPYQHLYTVHHLAFTYPPFALVALSPLAVLPREVSELGWLLVNVAALSAGFYVVLRRLGIRGGTDLWLAVAALSCLSVFLVEPVRSTIDYGQVNAVIMAACLFDMLWPGLRARGVLVGLAAAVKLTPLAFLLYFAVRRDLRALGRAAVAFALGTGVAWLLLPSASHAFWTSLVWDPERTGKLTYPGNLSWDAVVVRTGLDPSAARHLWMAAALVTVVVGAVAAVRCTRAGADVATVFVVALTGLLVSPVSWSHHWIWVVVGIPLVFSGRELPLRLRLLVSGLLVLTLLAPYWWFHPGGAASVAEALVPGWAFAVLTVTALTGLHAGRPSTRVGPGHSLVAV
ncbi:MAG: DUF2029 domain-containing protein, partial [Acidimicrobiales bacterium]|nr:DUF2029 domain-containing protein [Acidimicrobiales bacterium]